MPQEIERKYLVNVDQLPDLSGCHRRQIEQAYLSDRPTVRVRRDAQSYYLTYKGDGFLVREEYNLPLTAEAYAHLAAKADGYRISKERFELPLPDGLTAELDIFHGVHEGLLLVEVEFPSVEEANAFTAPDWFSTEVTADPAYSNVYLATQPYHPETQPLKQPSKQPARIRKQLLAGLAIALSTVVLGACGGGSDKDKASGSSSVVQTTDKAKKTGSKGDKEESTDQNKTGSNTKKTVKKAEHSDSKENTDSKKNTDSKDTTDSKGDTGNQENTGSEKNTDSHAGSPSGPDSQPTSQTDSQGSSSTDAPSSSDSDPQPAPEPQPAPTPAPPSGGMADLSQGYRVVVNKKHALSPNYAPGEDPTAQAAVMQVIAAMQQQGFDVSNSYSGFRSYETQAWLYQSYVDRDGQAAADTYSARPGYSEHQTGLAYDLLNSSGALLGTGAGDQAAVDWLASHAHEYGFIVRYQAGKEGITGYMAEAWHLRYLGVADATAVYNSGQTLEEYLGVAGGGY